MQHERKERNTQLLRNQQQEEMLLKIQQRAAACCKIKTNTATMPDLRTAAHHFKSLSKDSIQKQQKKKTHSNMENKAAYSVRSYEKYSATQLN